MTNNSYITVEEGRLRLSRILEEYKTETLRGAYRGRLLGAMEVLLMVVGKIKPAQAFDYIEIEVEVERVFTKNKTIKRPEHYEEHIIRLATEALAEG